MNITWFWSFRFRPWNIMAPRSSPVGRWPQNQSRCLVSSDVVDLHTSEFAVCKITSLSGYVNWFWLSLSFLCSEMQNGGWWGNCTYDSTILTTRGSFPFGASRTLREENVQIMLPLCWFFLKTTRFGTCEYRTFSAQARICCKHALLHIVYPRRVRILTFCIISKFYYFIYYYFFSASSIFFYTNRR